ncbi:IclR family transcriptional regulator [Streptomyces triticagri]|uniref:hypothetical protein n=1 Tax=Streptomyces triticagri TaxID=2293568 RepID=UPI001314073B|nr:hypothetical protein [Streptomyces triticagri]
MIRRQLCRTSGHADPAWTSPRPRSPLTIGGAVRPALVAGRALAVLDRFAAHPEQSYSLSESSQALDINLASLLSVLQSLTDAGHLVRHPRRKTYGLGMSLVAAGHAALTRHRVVDRARHELRLLAAESGAAYVVSAVAGDSIVVLAVEGRVSVRTPEVWAAQRLPLLPPLGQVFLAWSGPAEIRGWLDRTTPGARLPAHLDTAMAVSRKWCSTAHTVRKPTRSASRICSTASRQARCSAARCPCGCGPFQGLGTSISYRTSRSI